MPEEKRRLHRRHLIYYLRVFNQTTGQVLGHLVDITPQGVMLISEAPIDIGQAYHLRMSLPGEVFDKSELDFLATSLWSRPDINQDFFDTGFQISDLPAKDQEIIEYMIDHYGFRY